jgi:hypothetical protein
VFTQPFPSNGSISGNLILAVRIHVTIRNSKEMDFERVSFGSLVVVRNLDGMLSLRIKFPSIRIYISLNN